MEILPLKKIVYSDSFSDAEGNVVPGTYYDMGEDFPNELPVTFTFEGVGGKTRFTLKTGGLPVGEQLDGASSGWSTTIDKLQKFVERK